LLEFSKAAWHVIEPSKAFKVNWHHEAICDHLEAVYRREIKRLIINCPYRNLKSILVSVMFPAWCWVNDPSHKFITVSYAEKLAIRDNLKHRRIGESNWYRERFGNLWQFSGDQNQKGRFENDKSGYRIGFGITAGVMGEGADCVDSKTVIQTEIGGIPISDLVEMSSPPRVLSFNHLKGILEWRRIEASRVIESDDIIDIETCGGRNLRCTHRHRIYSSESGYREAGDLTDRDTIVSFVPNVRKENSQKGSESDGHVSWMPYEASSLVRESVSVVKRAGCGKIKVYDIQVEGNRNFFGNFILCHNCVIIDDPMDRAAANSDAERETVNVTYDEAISTRLNDPAESAIVLIMQRLHQADLTGHLLDKDHEDWVHLMIPMRYEYDRHCVTHFGGYTWEDPRRFDAGTGRELDKEECEGTLMDPDRFPEWVVRNEEAKGEFFSSGQLQQRPVPSGGGIIKEEYWQMWPPTNWPAPPFPQDRFKLPAFDYIIASLDTAMKEKEENDYSAMVVLGIWRETGNSTITPFSSVNTDGVVEPGSRIPMPESERMRCMLLYAWQKRLLLHGPPEEKPNGVTDEEWNSPSMRKQRSANWGLVEWVVDTCKQFKAHRLLIEDKTRGHDVKNELLRLFSSMPWVVEMVNPAGDKVSRAHAVQHLFSNRQIFAPGIYDHQRDEWRWITWADAVIKQCSIFPKGEHDDLVDAATQGLQHLRNAGLALRENEAEEVWDSEVNSSQRAKPLYDL
jgi:predicted phage terminase large subunit-like protein